MFIILLIITTIAIRATFSKQEWSKYYLLFSLIIAFFFTSYHNFLFHPHYQVWLCNFTALFAIILLIRFNQLMFDIMFYFAWVGDVFTFIVPNNQTLPSVNEYPIVWVAYWLKHIIPLCITIYLLFSENRRLSKHSMWISFSTFFVYTCFIAVYNVIFNQNIMDLQYPTVAIEQSFGPWPIYIFVDMIIILIWYYLINISQKKFSNWLDL